MFDFKRFGRRLNNYKTTHLETAMAEGDHKEIEYLRTKKDSYLANKLLCVSFAKVTPDIADVFINKFTDENWQRWGFKSGSREIILTIMMAKSMKEGRVEVFDLFFNSGIDLNKGKAEGHVIASILLGQMPRDTATSLVRRIVQKGIDKVEGPRMLVETAMAVSASEAFDTLVQATGTNIHLDNEALLREAAQTGNTAMARHLVKNHAADIALAFTTERTLGHDNSALLLDKLRLEINPHDIATPPTFETLSAEMKILKDAVRELTTEVQALRPPKLEKVTLKSPLPSTF